MLIPSRVPINLGRTLHPASPWERLTKKLILSLSLAIAELKFKAGFISVMVSDVIAYRANI